LGENNSGEPEENITKRESFYYHIDKGIKNNLNTSDDSRFRSQSSLSRTVRSNLPYTFIQRGLKINESRKKKCSSLENSWVKYHSKEFINLQKPEIEFKESILFKDYFNLKENDNYVAYSNRKINKNNLLKNSNTSKHNKSKLESRFKKIKDASLNSDSIEKNTNIIDISHLTGINFKNTEGFKRFNNPSDDKNIKNSALTILNKNNEELKDKEYFTEIIDTINKQKFKSDISNGLKLNKSSKKQNNNFCEKCEEKLNFILKNSDISNKNPYFNISENLSFIAFNNSSNNIIQNNNFFLPETSSIEYYRSLFISEWKKNLSQNTFSFEIPSQKKENLLHINKINDNNSNDGKLKSQMNYTFQKNSSKSENKYFHAENSYDQNPVNTNKINNPNIGENLNEKIKSNNIINLETKQNIENSYSNENNEMSNSRGQCDNTKNVLIQNSTEKQKTEKFNENTHIYIVVDDNLYIRNCLKKLLDIFFKNWKKNNPKEKIDFVIYEGIDGIDALKFVIDPNYSSRIKGIFIDENMEYLNGSEAIKIIRRLQNLNKISKLFHIATVTAFEDAITKTNILNAGVDDIYQKPINKNHIEDFFRKFPIKIHNK